MSIISSKRQLTIGVIFAWNALKHLKAQRATRASGFKLESFFLSFLNPLARVARARARKKASQCFTGVIAYAGKIFESYAAVILSMRSLFLPFASVYFHLLYNQPESIPKLVSGRPHWLGSVWPSASGRIRCSLRFVDKWSIAHLENKTQVYITVLSTPYDFLYLFFVSLHNGPSLFSSKQYTS